MSTNFAPLQKDFYKVSHVNQYPKGTELIYSNFTPRSGRLSNIPGSKGIYFIGLQYFIIKHLIREWGETFFKQPKDFVIQSYKEIVDDSLGETNVSHIESLYDLGYLPIEIKALPEGSFVPYGVPVLTIKNTLPEFFWVTNMIETVLSAELWLPCSTATTSRAFYNKSLEFSEKTCDDNSFVPFQQHDFSMRGMQCKEAAAISGFAFIATGSKGTDTIPAILLAKEYYGATTDIAYSVPASEHSVVCSGGHEDELETLTRIITEVYPTGIVSYVADSYDFWKVVTEYLPTLKDRIESREGKLVIRPDSGDPVDIICGIYPIIGGCLPEDKGLIECLWDTFGGTINSKGYKVLNPKIGTIYGDSITLDRQQSIFVRLEQKGFASNNIVFGIGSYSLGYVTRDTHGFALKSTYAIINGKSRVIFKDPKTDDGTKKSAKGLLMVSHENGQYTLNDNVEPKHEKHGCLEVVFKDGKLVKETSLAEIRKIVSDNL
jgi:nicotinamide phosphoribosyltransferase